MVFGAHPPLNVLAPGISMASVQNSQHFKKTKWLPRKFEHFTASGRSENTFPHILHDLGYILHSPKPRLFVCLQFSLISEYFSTFG